MERASAVGVAFDPDPPTMTLDDPLADGEADAAARVFVPAVQPLEYGEDPGGVFGLDPDSVVRDREDPVSLVTGRRYVDSRHGAGGDELDRVRDEVLEQLRELGLV